MRVNANRKSEPEFTHGGGQTFAVSDKIQLRRAVLSCFLWEDNFYESGVSIADRIETLAAKVSFQELKDLAIEARKVHNLRHVPLILLVAMLKRFKGNQVSDAIAEVISRPDEITELLAIYRRNKRIPIAKQLQKGIAKAFLKFNEYSLAKYKGEGKTYSLRDALFLSHAKPNTPERADLWKRLVNNQLAIPDTWEVELSSGADKKETFERLINEDRLGYFALIRNLRNMVQANVDTNLIKKAIKARKNGADKIIPYRFLAAGTHAPQFASELSDAMVANVSQNEKIPGKTIIVVDVSGSMCAQMSDKSNMTRLSAAAALAAVGREMFDDVVVYATAGSDWKRVHSTKIVPNYHGLALAEHITKNMYQSLGGGGIFLKQVIDYITEKEKTADRCIIITDEQDTSSSYKDRAGLANPIGKGYILNVASYKNGIGYGKWTHIDGFSENAFKFIREYESENS